MYKEIYNALPILGAHCGVGGEFRCILRDSMGGIDHDTGWFNNLITNTGLINLGVQTWAANCHIGNNNTAAAFTDTALLGWLARNNSYLAVSNGPTPTAPNYEFYQTIGYRFNAGTGTGTIQELGLSHLTSNSSMTIRAVISPGIVKAANQILDVYYRFTVWKNIVDVTGVVNIEGDDYDYTMRPNNINSANFEVFSLYQFLYAIGAGGCTAYTGNLAAITSIPTGFIGNASSIALVGSGSGYTDIQTYFSVDAANHVSGIRSLNSRCFASGGSRGFQVEFERQSDGETIQKTNNKDMYMTWRLSWARH